MAAGWLTEFFSLGTRQAYARDLAGFFVWCADRPVHVFGVARADLAAFLGTAKPDGSPFAPRTQERRLATLTGFYNYALDEGLIDKRPKGHRRPLSVTVKGASHAAALSRTEFERLTRAAAEHSPRPMPSSFYSAYTAYTSATFAIWESTASAGTTGNRS